MTSEVLTMAFYYVGGIAFDDHHSLMHYKTPGAKNGVRRYQNKDGSLTPLGRIHYGVGQARGGISNAYTSMKKKVTNAYNSGKEYLTGSNARKNLDRARSRYEVAGNDYKYEAGVRSNIAKQYRKLEKDALNSRKIPNTTYIQSTKPYIDKLNKMSDRYMATSDKFASAAAKNANAAKLYSKDTKDMAGNVHSANRGKASFAERQRERNELMSEKMYKKATTLKNKADMDMNQVRRHLKNRSNQMVINRQFTDAAKVYNRSAQDFEKASRAQMELYDDAKMRAQAEFAKAQKAYDRTLPGQIDRLRDSFNTTYSNVVKYVKETAEELYGKASKYYKETVQSITTGGKKAIEKAKKFLASIFG